MTDHGSDADRSAQGGASDAADDRWITDGPFLDADLPRDVQVALGRILAEDPKPTLGEWIAAIRNRAGDGAIDVGALCHADERTEHWGEMDGERYYFLCFYDAVVLSALSDRPVDIRTESPGGAVVEARADGTQELTVSPETAVFSFGIDGDIGPSSDGEPSLADVYAAVCPYVRAFPDRDAYERWRETVPAATVATPLPGATALAAALVE